MRRLIFLTLTMLTAWSVARAEDSDPAAKFLVVPQARWSTQQSPPDRFARDDLPRGLIALLTTQKSALPENASAPLEVQRQDLNGDGFMEFFVITRDGGTGGPHYLLCASFEDGWRVIASVQGVVYDVAPSEGPWAQLVVTTRSGVKSYAKTVQVFKDRRYEVTQSEVYENGQITVKK